MNGQVNRSFLSIFDVQIISDPYYYIIYRIYDICTYIQISYCYMYTYPNTSRQISIPFNEQFC